MSLSDKDIKYIILAVLVIAAGVLVFMNRQHNWMNHLVGYGVAAALVVVGLGVARCGIPLLDKIDCDEEN